MFLCWKNRMMGYAPAAKGALAVSLAFATSTGLADTDTWSLEQAVQAALTDGARVQSAAAGRDAAAARSDWRNSAYVPEAGLALSASRSRFSRTLTSIREPGVFPELDRDVYDAVLHAEWTIWDFEQGRAERRAALTRAHGAQIAYDLDRMETIERVAELFLLLALNGEQDNALASHIEELTRRETDMRNLWEEGRVAQVDLLRIREAVWEAEVQARALHQERAHWLKRLAAEMGHDSTPAYSDLQLPDLNPSYEFATMNVDGIEFRSPRVALANVQQEGAQFARDAAQKMRWPRVSLFGEHRTRTGGDFDEDNEWLIGAAIQMPLFQPRLNAEQRARVAEAKLARWDAETARHAVTTEARRLEDLSALAAERHAVARARIEHLEEMYRIDTLAHAEGRLSLSDLLNTKARLEAARTERLTAAADQRLLALRFAVLEGVLTLEYAQHLVGETP